LYHDILNQTLGFEKLYSIIMPSRTDLRDSLQLAAALTDLNIDIVDGSAAPEDPKAFPPHQPDFGTQNPAIGAWRAHMDVLRTIVEQNISSAVVMESDVDWDYRIKQQMQAFARASRLLSQPGAQDSWFEDGDRLIHPLPTTSPYGDGWDFLWLGHCGMDLPEDGGHLPIGRAAYHDPTVPPIDNMNLRGNFKDQLRQTYGEHSRVVSHTADPLCSIAYAITQRGARKFLYEMAVHKLDAAADLMFAWACDGVHGRKTHKCLAVNPQLFNQHRAAGPLSKASNIQKYKGEIRHSSTENIMYGTKVNFEALLEGKPE
ncbi:glycosyltransferase family 25 protein, partial [Cercospora zeae-maydis SCOH1-5]